jgi:hypothetical protein
MSFKLKKKTINFPFRFQRQVHPTLLTLATIRGKVKQGQIELRN